MKEKSKKPKKSSKIAKLLKTKVPWMIEDEFHDWSKGLEDFPIETWDLMLRAYYAGVKMMAVKGAEAIRNFVYDINE